MSHLSFGLGQSIPLLSCLMEHSRVLQAVLRVPGLEWEKKEDAHGADSR